MHERGKSEDRGDKGVESAGGRMQGLGSRSTRGALEQGDPAAGAVSWAAGSAVLQGPCALLQLFKPPA